MPNNKIENKAKNKQGKIYVVSGPSGSGKTTLLKVLRTRKEFRDSLVKVVTVTTRSPRAGERQGKDYQFLNKEEFQKRLHNAEFVESEEIFGNFYAVPKNDLLKITQSGKDALLCVDVKGALSVKHIFPDKTVLIFIVVPDFQSLSQRLHLRSTEKKEEIEKRLKVSQQEVEYAKYYDYLVTNDVVKRAVDKLSAIIIAERSKVEKQVEYRGY